MATPDASGFSSRPARTFLRLRDGSRTGWNRSLPGLGRRRVVAARRRIRAAEHHRPTRGGAALRAATSLVAARQTLPDHKRPSSPRPHCRLVKSGAWVLNLNPARNPNHSQSSLERVGLRLRLRTRALGLTKRQCSPFGGRVRMRPHWDGFWKTASQVRRIRYSEGRSRGRRWDGDGGGLGTRPAWVI